MDYKNDILKLARDSISLTIKGTPVNKTASTRLGGVPDVPGDFRWPCYITNTYDDNEVKPRPLAFIAQFNCEEISKYDFEHLLPEKGLLLFFYELDSQKWGFDPKDKGCAKVYWFESTEELQPASVPQELSEDFRLPSVRITAKSEKSYPSFADYSLTRDNMIGHWDEYYMSMKRIGVEDKDEIHKLLGWSNPIQGNMTMQCELIKRGYYLGDSWDHITPRDKQESIDRSGKDWLLLFQLSTVYNDELKLSLGDDGRIFFYIHRDDLAKRNFDNIWLILQSY